MKGLEKEISKKIGISQEDAHRMIVITVDYLKDRVPETVLLSLEEALGVNETSIEKEKSTSSFRVP